MFIALCMMTKVIGHPHSRRSLCRILFNPEYIVVFGYKNSEIGFCTGMAYFAIISLDMSRVANTTSKTSPVRE